MEELGLTQAMREHIAVKLLSPPELSVDEQLRAAELEKSQLRDHLSRQGEHPLSEEEHTPLREASSSGVSARTVALTAGAAGVLGGLVGFFAAEREKREAGRATTADALSPQVAMPYQWASASTALGIEFVKKARTPGELFAQLWSAAVVPLTLAHAGAGGC